MVSVVPITLAQEESIGSYRSWDYEKPNFDVVNENNLKSIDFSKFGDKVDVAPLLEKYSAKISKDQWDQIASKQLLTTKNIGVVDFNDIPTDVDLRYILAGDLRTSLSDTQWSQLKTEHLTDQDVLAFVPDLTKLDSETLNGVLRKNYGMSGQLVIQPGVKGMTISGKILSHKGEKESEPYTINLEKESDATIIKAVTDPNKGGFEIIRGDKTTKIESDKGLFLEKTGDTYTLRDTNGNQLLQMESTKEGSVELKGNQIIMSEGTRIIPEGSHGLAITAHQNGVIVDITQKDGQTNFAMSNSAVVGGKYHGVDFEAKNFKGTMTLSVPTDQTKPGRLSVDATDGTFTFDKNNRNHVYKGNFKVNYDNNKFQDVTLRGVNSNADVGIYGKLKNTDGRPTVLNSNFKDAIELRRWSGTKKDLQIKLDTLKKEGKDTSGIETEIDVANSRIKNIYNSLTDNGKKNIMYADGKNIVGIGNYEYKNNFGTDLTKTVTGMNNNAIISSEDAFHGETLVKDFTIDTWDQFAEETDIGKIASEYKIFDANGKEVLVSGKTRPVTTFKATKSNGVMSIKLSRKDATSLGNIWQKGYTLGSSNIKIVPVSEAPNVLKGLYLDSDALWVASDKFDSEGKKIDMTDGSNIASTVTKLKDDKTKLLTSKGFLSAIKAQEQTNLANQVKGISTKLDQGKFKELTKLHKEAQALKTAGKDPTIVHKAIQNLEKQLGPTESKEYYSLINQRNGLIQEYQNIDLEQKALKNIDNSQLTYQLQDYKKSIINLESTLGQEGERYYNDLTKAYNSGDINKLKEIASAQGTPSVIKQFTQSQIGALHQQKGEWVNAINYYEESGQIKSANAAREAYAKDIAQREIQKVLQENYGKKVLSESEINTRVSNALNQVSINNKKLDPSMVAKAIENTEMDRMQARAKTLSGLGKNDAANVIYEDLNKKRETSKSLQDLSNNYRALGDIKKAEEYQQRAISKKYAETNYQTTKNDYFMFENLANIQASQNKFDPAKDSLDLAGSYLGNADHQGEFTSFASKELEQGKDKTDWYRLRNSYGNILNTEGSHSDADTEFTNTILSLEKDSKNTQNYINARLGRSETYSGRLDDADYILSLKKTDLVGIENPDRYYNNIIDKASVIGSTYSLNKLDDFIKDNTAGKLKIHGVTVDNIRSIAPTHLKKSLEYLKKASTPGGILIAAQRIQNMGDKIGLEKEADPFYAFAKQKFTQRDYLGLDKDPKTLSDSEKQTYKERNFYAEQVLSQTPGYYAKTGQAKEAAKDFGLLLEINPSEKNVKSALEASRIFNKIGYFDGAKDIAKNVNGMDKLSVPLKEEAKNTYATIKRDQIVRQVLSGETVDWNAVKQDTYLTSKDVATFEDLEVETKKKSVDEFRRVRGAMINGGYDSSIIQYNQISPAGQKHFRDWYSDTISDEEGNYDTAAKQFYDKMVVQTEVSKFGLLDAEKRLEVLSDFEAKVKLQENQYNQANTDYNQAKYDFTGQGISSEVALAENKINEIAPQYKSSKDQLFQMRASSWDYLDGTQKREIVSEYKTTGDDSALTRDSNEKIIEGTYKPGALATGAIKVFDWTRKNIGFGVYDNTAELQDKVDENVKSMIINQNEAIDAKSRLSSLLKKESTDLVKTQQDLKEKLSKTTDATYAFSIRNQISEIEGRLKTNSKEIAKNGIYVSQNKGVAERYDRERDSFHYIGDALSKDEAIMYKAFNTLKGAGQYVVAKTQDSFSDVLELTPGLKINTYEQETRDNTIIRSSTIADAISYDIDNIDSRSKNVRQFDDNMLDYTQGLTFNKQDTVTNINDVLGVNTLTAAERRDVVRETVGSISSGMSGYDKIDRDVLGAALLSRVSAEAQAESYEDRTGIGKDFVGGLKAGITKLDTTFDRIFLRTTGFNDDVKDHLTKKRDEADNLINNAEERSKFIESAKNGGSLTTSSSLNRIGKNIMEQSFNSRINLMERNGANQEEINSMIDKRNSFSREYDKVDTLGKIADTALIDWQPDKAYDMYDELAGKHRDDKYIQESNKRMQDSALRAIAPHAEGIHDINKGVFTTTVMGMGISGASSLIKGGLNKILGRVKQTTGASSLTFGEKVIGAGKSYVEKATFTARPAGFIDEFFTEAIGDAAFKALGLDQINLDFETVSSLFGRGYNNVIDVDVHQYKNSKAELAGNVRVDYDSMSSVDNDQGKWSVNKIGSTLVATNSKTDEEREFKTAHEFNNFIGNGRATDSSGADVTRFVNDAVADINLGVRTTAEKQMQSEILKNFESIGGKSEILKTGTFEDVQNEVAKFDDKIKGYGNNLASQYYNSKAAQAAAEINRVDLDLKTDTGIGSDILNERRNNLKNNYDTAIDDVTKATAAYAAETESYNNNQRQSTSNPQKIAQYEAETSNARSQSSFANYQKASNERDDIQRQMDLIDQTVALAENVDKLTPDLKQRQIDTRSRLLSLEQDFLQKKSDYAKGTIAKLEFQRPLAKEDDVKVIDQQIELASEEIKKSKQASTGVGKVIAVNNIENILNKKENLDVLDEAQKARIDSLRDEENYEKEATKEMEDLRKNLIDMDEETRNKEGLKVMLQYAGEQQKLSQIQTRKDILLDRIIEKDGAEMSKQEMEDLAKDSFVPQSVKEGIYLEIGDQFEDEEIFIFQETSEEYLEIPNKAANIGTARDGGNLEITQQKAILVDKLNELENRLEKYKHDYNAPIENDVFMDNSGELITVREEVKTPFGMYRVVEDSNGDKKKVTNDELQDMEKVIPAQVTSQMKNAKDNHEGTAREISVINALINEITDSAEEIYSFIDINAADRKRTESKKATTDSRSQIQRLAIQRSQQIQNNDFQAAETTEQQMRQAANQLQEARGRESIANNEFSTIELDQFDNVINIEQAIESAFKKQKVIQSAVITFNGEEVKVDYIISENDEVQVVSARTIILQQTGTGVPVSSDGPLLDVSTHSELASRISTPTSAVEAAQAEQSSQESFLEFGQDFTAPIELTGTESALEFENIFDQSVIEGKKSPDAVIDAFKSVGTEDALELASQLESIVEEGVSIFGEDITEQENAGSYLEITKDIGCTGACPRTAAIPKPIRDASTQGTMEANKLIAGKIDTPSERAKQKENYEDLSSPFFIALSEKAKANPDQQKKLLALTERFAELRALINVENSNSLITSRIDVIVADLMSEGKFLEGVNKDLVFSEPFTQAMIKAGKNNLGNINALLKSPDQEVRVWAAKVIGSIQNRASLVLLLQAKDSHAKKIGLNAYHQYLGYYMTQFLTGDVVKDAAIKDALETYLAGPDIRFINPVKLGLQLDAIAAKAELIKNEKDNVNKLIQDIANAVEFDDTSTKVDAKAEIEQSTLSSDTKDRLLKYHEDGKIDADQVPELIQTLENIENTDEVKELQAELQAQKRKESADAAEKYVDNLEEKEIAQYITYHNKKHIQALADFAQRTVEIMRQLGIELSPGFGKLMETAAWAHDYGYYQVDGVFHTYKIDHETRSQKLLEAAQRELGLTNKEVQLVKYMIQGTIFANNANDIMARHNVLDKLINGESLNEQEQNIVNELKQTFSEFNFERQEDLKEIRSASFGSRVLGTADIYGSEFDKISTIPGLNDEFKLDANTLAKYMLDNGATEDDIKTIMENPGKEAAQYMQQQGYDEKMQKAAQEFRSISIYKGKIFSPIMINGKLNTNNLLTNLEQIAATKGFNNFAQTRIDGLGVEGYLSQKDLTTAAKNTEAVNRVSDLVTKLKSGTAINKQELDELLLLAKQYGFLSVLDDVRTIVQGVIKASNTDSKLLENIIDNQRAGVFEDVAYTKEKLDAALIDPFSKAPRYAKTRSDIVEIVEESETPIKETSVLLDLGNVNAPVIGTNGKPVFNEDLTLKMEIAGMLKYTNDNLGGHEYGNAIKQAAIEEMDKIAKKFPGKVYISTAGTKGLEAKILGDINQEDLVQQINKELIGISERVTARAEELAEQALKLEKGKLKGHFPSNFAVNVGISSQSLSKEQDVANQLYSTRYKSNLAIKVSKNTNQLESHVAVYDNSLEDVVNKATLEGTSGKDYDIYVLEQDTPLVKLGNRYEKLINIYLAKQVGLDVSNLEQQVFGRQVSQAEVEAEMIGLNAEIKRLSRLDPRTGLSIMSDVNEVYKNKETKDTRIIIGKGGGEEFIFEQPAPIDKKSEERQDLESKIQDTEVLRNNAVNEVVKSELEEDIAELNEEKNELLDEIKKTKDGGSVAAADGDKFSTYNSYTMWKQQLNRLVNNPSQDIGLQNLGQIADDEGILGISDVSKEVVGRYERDGKGLDIHLINDIRKGIEVLGIEYLTTEQIQELISKTDIFEKVKGKSMQEIDKIILEEARANDIAPVKLTGTLSVINADNLGIDRGIAITFADDVVAGVGKELFGRNAVVEVLSVKDNEKPSDEFDVQVRRDAPYSNEKDYAKEQDAIDDGWEQKGSDWVKTVSVQKGKDGKYKIKGDLSEILDVTSQNSVEKNYEDTTNSEDDVIRDIVGEVRQDLSSC